MQFFFLPQIIIFVCDSVIRRTQTFTYKHIRDAKKKEIKLIDIFHFLFIPQNFEGVLTVV